MLTPTSSEFIALCRDQLCLLSEPLGASLSVVYLTEQLIGREGAKLVPVAIEPETTVIWDQKPDCLGLPESRTRSRDNLLQLQPAAPSQSLEMPPEEESPPGGETQEWLPGHQLVLPLVHEGVVMGFLVTTRQDRPWSDGEQGQIDRIARTIALACILDRRSQWWESRYQHQKQLHAQQRDTLDNLLHQFRNPLTALKIFGKLLLKRLQPGDASWDFAGSIVRESDRLQELLQQFKQTLDWESEELALPPSPEKMAEVETEAILLLPEMGERIASVSVMSVLNPLVVSARAIADDRGLELHCHIPSDLPQVQGNAQALREVLSNSIDNALKYTPSKGCVYIQAGEKLDESGQRRVAIAVSDTGVGIPPQDLEHLFERGYRGEKAEGEIPGTGLGLAIARELLERMDGEIQVFSPAQPPWEIADFPPEVGTTIVVELPIA